MNGLRSRVRIEADSKLMSGRDVAIAALLGAEEFGFGTGPLVAMGCVMMRVCNLDTCPMGICTQNPELRKRFKGKPEYIMNFMRFMAEDLREYMAKLGVRTVDELVGRTDLLKVKAAPAGSRAGEMDLTALLQNPPGREHQRTLQREGCLQLPAGKDPRHTHPDEEVQKRASTPPSRSPAPSRWTSATRTARSARSLAARSPPGSATRCPTTRSMSSATATAARASARSSPRA